MKSKLECRLSSFLLAKKIKEYRFALYGFVNKIKNLTRGGFYPQESDFCNTIFSR